MKKKLVMLFGNRIIQLIANFTLGGLFVYASISKIMYPFEFSKIIYNYRLLPDFLINFTAVTLPWIELISGILLVFGIFTRSSAIILSSLLIIFIIAIGISIIRGIDLSCGCFSINARESNTNGFLLIARDLLMLIPGMIIIFFGSNREKIPGN